MKTLILKLFTGADNQTPDIGRLIWFLGSLVFFSCTILDVVYNRKFNGTDYGVAFAAILAGGAGALKLKQSTEPLGDNNVTRTG